MVFSAVAGGHHSSTAGGPSKGSWQGDYPQFFSLPLPQQAQPGDLQHQARPPAAGAWRRIPKT